MKALFERRSIRKYIDKPVSMEDIETIIKAGMGAPSAGNAQPWDFIIINDKQLLNEITKIHPYSKMLNEVQCAIVVCGVLEREIHKGFWVQDCSAATQNMLITAQDLGLGSVWLGVYPEEERYKGIQNLLEIPKNVIPFSIVPIGYPNEKKEPSNRFDKGKIHINKW